MPASDSQELSSIRDRTKRKHGKKASDATTPRQPARFEVGLRRVARGAHLKGGPRRVTSRIKVDADERHQACPRCVYTSRENGSGQGLLFVCSQCHYTLHADLVGARNVAL